MTQVIEYSIIYDILRISSIHSVLGVSFVTPETYFNGEAEGEWSKPAFDPHRALKVSTLLEPPTSKICEDIQELVLMVGFPASGKSHFSTKHLKDYSRVNRDTLGNWQKCVAR